MANETESETHGMMGDLITAMSDKHSELEVRLDRLTLTLGDNDRASIHMSGLLTVTVHLRGMSEEEKDAHSTAAVGRLHG